MSNEQGHKPVIHTKKHIARLERERQQTRLVLFLFFGLIAAVVLLLVYGYLDIHYFQLRKPVAKVNNVQISAAEFQSRVKIQRQQLLVSYQQSLMYQQLGMDTSQQQQQIQSSLDTPGTIGQSIIDQMINEEVVRQEAAKMGITVSKDELEKAVQANFGYYPNGMPTPTLTATAFATLTVPAEAFNIVTRTPLPTETPAVATTPLATSATTLSTPGTPEAATLAPSATATLVPTATETAGPTATITPTATPYTLDGYQNAYATAVTSFSKYGMTDADYRKFVETGLLQQKVKDAVIKDVGSTQSQIWARHILVADEATAQDLIKRLNSGEDFAALAKQYSTDTSSGANGGDLGWFAHGAMVPEFETAAFALTKPGDITQTPVKSQFGYHIIQLIAKQDKPLTADEISKARDAKFTDWVKTTRATYTVVIDDVLWKSVEPTEPSLSSMATESALTAIVQATNSRSDTATAAASTPIP